MLFAYGVPAVSVAVAAAGWPGGYGQNNVCWLSTSGSRVILAFAGVMDVDINCVIRLVSNFESHILTGPVAAAMLVYLFYHLRTMCGVHSKLSRQESSDGSEAHAKTRRALLASGAFYVVMGLGWVFGVRASHAEVNITSTSDDCDRC